MSRTYLINRQKVLISVISALGNRASKFMIEKMLFLLKKEEGIDMSLKFYNFFPYKFGPYSYMSYVDIGILENKGFLSEQNKRLALTSAGVSLLENVDVTIKQKVKKTADRFKSDSDIKSYVYDNYPWYTVNSSSPRMGLSQKGHGICSIGYEGYDIDSFLNRLLENGIEVLVDIRYNPFSMNFSFTKNKFKKYLENVGIEYLHVPELGIRGELRKNLETDEDYRKLFEEYKKTTLQENTVEVEKLIDMNVGNAIEQMFNYWLFELVEKR